MNLINFIAKTIFYVTALLTPIIFSKAALNPTSLINVGKETLLICTCSSIEWVSLLAPKHWVYIQPNPQTIEAILNLTSINVPELINANDIQIMSKIASLNDVELKNFSNLAKLPCGMSITVNVRHFFISILTNQYDTILSSKIYGSAARINDLLDYYLVSRNDTLKGFNPNKNFLQMLEIHNWNINEINKILPNTLHHIDLKTVPCIFEAAINNNIEPFPGYNELESIVDINVKLRKEIVNSDKFSLELQQAAKNNYESINDNLKKSKNNMWPIYFIICVGTMLTSELIMAFTQ